MIFLKHDFKYIFDLKKLTENPVSVTTGICCPQGFESFHQSLPLERALRTSGQISPAEKGSCLGPRHFKFSSSPPFMLCPWAHGPLLRLGALGLGPSSWSPRLGKGAAAFDGWGALWKAEAFLEHLGLAVLDLCGFLHVFQKLLQFLPFFFFFSWFLPF